MSDSEREKVIQALKAGRVEFGGNFVESVNSMDWQNPDFSITQTELRAWGATNRHPAGFSIEWRTKSAGFGSTTVTIDKETGEVHCENEGMGPRFLLSVFEHLIGQMKLADAHPR